MVKRRVALFWITSIVCLGFLQLLFSRQFVHDDMSMIYFNFDFLGVKSWRDCFHFVLQQTKPITNLVLALSNWWFGFTVLGQRALSLALHIAVVAMWFMVLDRFCRRAKLPVMVAPVAAVLFAIAPVHTETLGVAQFRGEILATLFTLVAWYIAPYAVSKRSPLYLVAVLFCVALASFSKEIFFAISLAAVTWEWARLSDLESRLRIRRFNCFFSLCLVAGFLWVTLYRLYNLDKDSAFSYLGNVGFSYDSSALWLKFSARSLWEGIYKLFTGDGLTTVRLTTRDGIGSRFTVLTHLIFLTALLYGLGRAFVKAPETRGLLVLLGLGIGFYIVIPNANAGSEHYWYFAAAPAFALFTLFLFRHVRSRGALVVLTSAYAIFLFSSLQNRLMDYRTRKDFARAEITAHPESWWSWVNWGLAQAEAQKPKEVVDSIFQKANDMGGDVLMPSHRLVAAIAMRDVERLDGFINDCMQKGFRGRGLSGLLARASLVFWESGERVKALAAARTSLMYYTRNEAGRRLLNHLESELYRSPRARDFIARPTLPKEEKKEDAS